MSELTLQQANRIIEAVLQSARAQDMPPLAVAVLDTGAHLKAMACNTDQLAERYNQGAQQRGFIDALNAMTGGKLIPLPGGVLVRNEAGDIVAAVGAAGGVSEDDEACVRKAITSSGFAC